MDGILALLVAPLALALLAHLSVFHGAETRDGFSGEPDPGEDAPVRRWP